MYLQLLYEGWSVHVGKLYGKEVDFVATKDGRVLYVQVTDEMFASETRGREIAPLKSIRDYREKIVVVRQGSYDTDIDGIRIVSARDFFLWDHAIHREAARSSEKQCLTSCGDGTRSVAAPKTGRYWSDGTAELGPSGGSKESCHLEENGGDRGSARVVVRAVLEKPS